jgi:uncharacterized flavoprotein (TIGR03862 family)
VVTSSGRTIAIVGAGPAGLMAAERLAQRGHAVTIYERMPSPARKFLMAGRGGLNLTHTEPLHAFLDRYGPTRANVADQIVRFSPDSLTGWVQALGIATFVGTSGRVFPRTMKASPLLRAWLGRLETLGVRLQTRHEWQGFDADGTLLVRDATGAVQKITCDATLLALGGASWPRLGANGAWVPILEEADIKVAPLVSANCGLDIAWSPYFIERFAGSPLKRVTVTLGDQESRAEATVTTAGLEGGAVYAVASHARRLLAARSPVTLTLDLRPEQSHRELAARLALPRSKQSTATFLRKATHLSPVGIALLREPGPLPTDPGALAARIKGVRLAVTGLAGLDRAISTAGGVKFSALDANAMLRAKPGVFVAGEMLDWDAPTGGYLLQATFATAVHAAHGIDRWLGDQTLRTKNAESARTI